MQIVERVKGILLTPQNEWRVIAREPGDIATLFVNYVAILAAIPAICGFIGYAIVGLTTGVGTLRIGYGSALASALIGYVMAFVSVYVVALVADVLAPTFNAERNFNSALKLAVYSYTPVWLVGIFLLMPALSFLRILGLYGAYLLWLGLPVLMRAPERQNTTIGYGAAIALSAVIIWYIVRYVISVVIRVSVWSM
jgi:hypothetical protein